MMSEPLVLRDGVSNFLFFRSSLLLQIFLSLHDDAIYLVKEIRQTLAKNSSFSCQKQSFATNIS